MKKFFAFALLFVLPFFVCGCKKKETTYRMQSVTYFQNGENITVLAEELKEQMPDGYEPNGGLFDNYFFTLVFGQNGEGRAVFVFSELGDSFKNATADTFTIEEKSSGVIVLTFTNGKTLSGERQHNKLVLSSFGVSYVFEKT